MTRRTLAASAAARLLVLLAMSVACWPCGCRRSPEEPPAPVASPGPRSDAALEIPSSGSPSTGGAEDAAPLSGVDGDASASTASGDAVEKDEAEPDFWQRLAENKAEFDLRIEEAAAALERGDRGRAHELYDALLASAPRHQTFLRVKIGLCREDGRHAEALEVLDRALEDDPSSSFLLYQKALVEAEMGAPDDALESIELAVATGDRATLARYLRATLLARRGDRDGALVALEESLESGFLDVRRLEMDADTGGPFTALRDEPRFQEMVERLRARRARATKADAIERHIDSMVENQKQFHSPPPENTSTSDAGALLRGVDERLQKSSATELTLSGLVLVDGRPLRLEDFRGKPVVLHVWGMWSPTARRMLPDLARLEEELRETELVVVTLCHEYMFDERTARGLLDTFIATGSKPLRTALISSAVVKELGVEAFPTTLFLGRDGKVYSSSTGEKSLETMRRIVERLAAGTSAR